MRFFYENHGFGFSEHMFHICTIHCILHLHIFYIEMLLHPTFIVFLNTTFSSGSYEFGKFTTKKWTFCILQAKPYVVDKKSVFLIRIWIQLGLWIWIQLGLWIRIQEKQKWTTKKQKMNCFMFSLGGWGFLLYVT